MTVARRSAAIFEQLRPSLLLVSANFGRILSDRLGQERTSLFGPQLCGKPLLCVRLPGLDRQAPRTAATGDLEGAAE
ncbi:MAG: hypothetical protein ACPIOQ_10175 [Promethearchaeia archaeon]